MAKAYRITLVIDLSATPGRNLMRGIARYARLYGPWQLNHIWRDLYERTPGGDIAFLESLKKNLKNSDGLIMREPYAVDFVKDLDIPMVIASAIRDAEVFTKPTVLTNSQTIGAMGANYFIQKGFKNLAFCGFKDMLWSEHRQTYFEQTAKQAGLEVYKYSFTYPHREAKETKLDSLVQWIRQLPKPVGIMCCNDLCGKFVVDSCRRSSIAVPQEVAVLGVDNDDILCDLTYPSLSSIELNTTKGGFEAAALLDKLIKGVKTDTNTIVIEPVAVQERQSTDIIAVEDRTVSDVLDFIKNNAQKPLQVADILQEFNISRRSLYKKFKESIGTSVYAQIRKIRVEKICRMLLETNKSVKEIAYELGFNSVDHIARFFRREKGITPTQYRSKYK